MLCLPWVSLGHTDTSKNAKYPFHPHVTAVVRKRPRSFCQKCRGRLQLNVHAPYVCGFAWSDMVHGCMVYTECADMAAVSCGTSHASAVSTPLRWIFKNTLYRSIHSCRITWECSESAREQRIALYKSNQQQQVYIKMLLCAAQSVLWGLSSAW